MIRSAHAVGSPDSGSRHASIAIPMSGSSAVNTNPSPSTGVVVTPSRAVSNDRQVSGSVVEANCVVPGMIGTLVGLQSRSWVRQHTHCSRPTSAAGRASVVGGSNTAVVTEMHFQPKNSCHRLSGSFAQPWLRYSRVHRLARVPQVHRLTHLGSGSLRKKRSHNGCNSRAPTARVRCSAFAAPESQWSVGYVK